MVRCCIALCSKYFRLFRAFDIRQWQTYSVKCHLHYVAFNHIANCNCAKSV